jgi:hypothetical protein
MRFHEVTVTAKAHRKLLRHRISQTPEFMMVFNEIFNRENFARVIEIGTFHGGLSLFLAFCALVQNMQFHTFDMRMNGKTEVYAKIRRLGGTFEKLNIFQKPGIDKIKQLISAPGRVMLLCDGGDKPKEIQTFAPFLKKDDIIMGHDYFDTKKSWGFQQKWLSCALVKADIQGTCKKYNLAPWYEHVLPEIFWVGRIKK